MTLAAITVSATSALRLARGVKMRVDKVRERTVLLAPERTIALDQTGIAIISHLDGKSTLDEIVRTLAETYQAPVDIIRQDATRFLQELADKRYLETLP